MTKRQKKIKDRKLCVCTYLNNMQNFREACSAENIYYNSTILSFSIKNTISLCYAANMVVLKWEYTDCQHCWLFMSANQPKIKHVQSRERIEFGDSRKLSLLTHWTKLVCKTT